MQQRTCEICSSEFLGSPTAKYCTKTCINRGAYLRSKINGKYEKMLDRKKRQYWDGDRVAIRDSRRAAKPLPDREPKECSTPGCAKPHRAMGLCSTHYNRQHQRVAVTQCAACGCEVLKDKQQAKRGRVVCSYACRSLLQNGRGASCPVPASHISRAQMCWVPRDHPSRNPLRIRSCDWCDSEYIARRWVDRYCTPACKSRAMGMLRRSRESDGHVYSWTHVMRVFALLDYRCAYCGQQPDGQPEPDHVVPLSRHGSNGNGNILPSCRPCNSDKRDLLLHEWAKDRARRGKQPVRTALDRSMPAFAHLLPDAIASGDPSSFGSHAA